MKMIRIKHAYGRFNVGDWVSTTDILKEYESLQDHVSSWPDAIVNAAIDPIKYECRKALKSIARDEESAMLNRLHFMQLSGSDHFEDEDLPLYGNEIDNDSYLVDPVYDVDMQEWSAYTLECNSSDYADHSVNVLMRTMNRDYY